MRPAFFNNRKDAGMGKKGGKCPINFLNQIPLFNQYTIHLTLEKALPGKSSLDGLGMRCSRLARRVLKMEPGAPLP